MAVTRANGKSGCYVRRFALCSGPGLMNDLRIKNKLFNSIVHCHLLRDLHGADVRVEAGENDAPLAGFLQHAGQDDVQVGVHVEVGRQVALPRPVLTKQSKFGKGGG